MISSVDKMILEIYNSLPPGALFVVLGGDGASCDPELRSLLEEKRTSKDRTQWLEQNGSCLQEKIEKARESLVFITIKKGSTDGGEDETVKLEKIP